MCASGADNEIWSYGPEAEAVMTRYIALRHRLKPYLTQVMAEAHEKGTPVIKPLFYDFPEDPAAWQVEDQFLLGHDLLAAPVLEEGQRRRKVVLPAGQTVEVDAPLEQMPLFVRAGAPVQSLLTDVYGGVKK